jgi:ankyrin repeat protein
VTVLHAAAAAGHGPLLEFLLLNGSSWSHTDIRGRSALHYAILFDGSECAKVLLRRGAAELCLMQDDEGRTAMDLVMAQGRVQDEELFLLLSLSAA